MGGMEAIAVCVLLTDICACAQHRGKVEYTSSEGNKVKLSYTRQDVTDSETVLRKGDKVEFNICYDKRYPARRRYALCSTKCLVRRWYDCRRSGGGGERYVTTLG